MRTFSLTEGTSDKFWHIDVAGDTVTVHYGRHGTKGQAKATQYGSAADADREAEKLVAAKVRKGYQEYDAGGSAMPAPAEPARDGSRPTQRAQAEPTGDEAPAGTSPAPADETPAGTTGGVATAEVTARPLAPAPGAAPSTADPDDLGVRLSRLEEAALGWGRPLDDYAPAGTPFDLKATEAWVRQNAVRYQEWGDDVIFTTPPFDGIPGREQAGWWLWWYFGVTGKYQWGGPPPTLRDRLAMVRSGHAARQPFPEKRADSLHVDEFVTVAADVALHGAGTALSRYLGADGTVSMPSAARGLVVRQLDASTRAALRARAEAETDPENRLRQFALLADPQEYAALVAALPDDVQVYHPPAHHPSLPAQALYAWYTLPSLLTALPDQATARATFERISPANNPTEAVVGDDYPWTLPLLLAAVGADVLPYTVAALLRMSNQTAIGGLLGMLTARVHGPAAVAAMVRLARESRAPEPARTWLVSHPEALAATTEAFTPRDTGVLEGVVREILAARPDAFAGGVTNPAVAGVLDALRQEASTPGIRLGEEPAWWREAVAAEAAAPVPDASAKGSLAIPRALPGYAAPGALPAMVVDGRRLDEGMAEAVVWSAVRGTNAPDLAARPLVAAVRDRMERATRDRVATALMQGWLGSGAASKERALFVASGYLGADGFVQQLAPLVRDWPGESQHQRAVLGLNVLAATGTKAALQAISGIAGKSKFRGVQEAAKASMATLAALQGLTADQLADRVVPDGGLDARGSRVFGYGPRSFRVTLSPQGKLVVRDLDADGRPTGKPRTALPAPNSRDDAGAAASAKAEFGLLRKQLGDLARIQTARLEQAMVTGRSWSGAEHREFLVGNPLLNSLIRPLVWEVMDGGSRTLVRVTEEREYLTVDEDVAEPSDAAQLRLAHPLGLSEAERAAWQQHLTDYDLIAPVEQLDRAVFAVPAGLAGRDLPARLLPQGKIHPGSLIGTLEKFGWRRGSPADAGVINFCWLPFPELDQAVVIQIMDGLWTGMIAESGDQEITRAALLRPDIPPTLWYVEDAKESIDWSDVHPLVFSETLRTFAALAEKIA